MIRPTECIVMALRRSGNIIKSNNNRGMLYCFWSGRRCLAIAKGHQVNLMNVEQR